MINSVIVVFNMIPAFPLDGGRVLRSILWHYKGNLRWATRIAASLGSEFGLVLIILSVDELMENCVYRLHEVFDTYGPAIKQVIHEEFGDGNGIMSAIDFEIHIERKEDPTGDRVVITLDGKFLPYGSRGKYPW